MRVRVGMVLLVLVVETLHAGVFQKGRVLEDSRDFNLRLTVGQISDFTAMVEETTRRVYEVTGEDWKQDTAEGYDLSDFNIGESHQTFGLSMDKGWTYFTFQLDASYLSIQSTTEAQRDYYIGVGGEVEYGGRSYDQMKIPRGQEFSFDVDGATVEMRLLVTPFTICLGEVARLTPFLDLSIFGFGGRYDIDAGDPTGVATYQNPPELFVVGGQSDGMLGMGLPQYGGGAELRLGAADRMNLVLQGHYTILAYDGSSSLLTSSEHREKNADIDHRNIKLRAFLEFPVRQNSMMLTVGLQYQKIESEGLISSTETDPDIILAKRERFDKQVEFGMQTVSAMVGLAF